MMFFSVCPENTYGKDCQGQCNCHNDALCDKMTGTCSCGMGWTGETCQVPCEDGLYGPNCTQNCICQNGGSCDRFSGCCKCQPGWYGQQCEYGKSTK